MAWTDFFTGKGEGSFTEQALRQRQAELAKQQEEDAYREKYKAGGGQILSQGDAHTPVGDLVSSGLEWLGLGGKGAYDFGQKIEHAAELSPYGSMKKVDQGDFAGAAEDLVGGGKEAMFLPAGSKNLHLPALSRRLAENLEKSGADPKAVFKQTGYFRDRDGRWIYEMGDQGMKVRSDTPEAQTISDISSAMKVEPAKLPMVGSPSKSVPGPHPLLRMRPEFQHHPGQLDIFHDTDLGADAGDAAVADMRSRYNPSRSEPAASEIFKHDNLWAAAPDLADVRMAETGYGSSGGVYYPSTGSVGAARGPPGEVGKKDSMESVALHELQHAVQHQHAMPGGSNPNVAGSAELGQEAARRSGEEYERLAKVYRDRVEELKQQGMFSDEAFDQADKEMPNLFEARQLAEGWSTGNSSYRSANPAFHGYMSDEGEAMARLAQTRATLDPKTAGDTHPFEHLDMPPSVMFRPQNVMGLTSERTWQGPGGVGGTFGEPGKFDWLWRR